MFNDIREFVAKLEVENELKRIREEVDWNLEIGAITRRCLDLKAPAPLFEKVKDYPEGYRVLGCPLGPTKPVVQGRLAIALGLPKETSTLKVVEEFGQMLQREPIRPRILDDGPCRENIHTGDEVDLFEFPVPLIHGTDVERYIGTWHATVTKDRDSDWVNWGMYRHSVHDKKTLGLMMNPPCAGWLHYQKFEKQNEDMPIAIAIGPEPASGIVSGMSVSHPPEESDYAGAIRGTPVDLVKCETVDLYVPATSEIVIEGIVKPKERIPEGPFGEWHGYSAGGTRPQHVIHVSCITHRNDPILTMTNMGKPWDEYGVLSSVALSASIAKELRQRGFKFKSVYVPPPCMAVIVSTDEIYGGYAHALASAIFSCTSGTHKPYVIIVGEDVDVTNMEDVFWCLTSRMHPAQGIMIESGTPGQYVLPFLYPEEKEIPDRVVSHRAVFNATFPFRWPREKVPTIIDFEHAWPAEVKKKVLENWKKYGYE